MDSKNIKPGTAIATMDENGKDGGHSAIFIKQTDVGILVVEQYNPGHGESGRYPKVREIWRANEQERNVAPAERDYSNRADWFRVIVTK